MGLKAHDLADIYLNEKNRNVAFKAAINIRLIKKFENLSSNEREKKSNFF
jgi:hypothetical protein